ncbi:MAG: hypothetical protein M1541_17115, partial [Acidobacteria bacterium]|nr:hypothetical protein [Acidobacteriota bacterium]
MLRQHTTALELLDLTDPLSEQRVVVGRQNEHSLVTSLQIWLAAPSLHMRQDGIRRRECHERLPHPDFVCEDLDFETVKGARIEKPIEQSVHSALLARGVS